MGVFCRCEDCSNLSLHVAGCADVMGRDRGLGDEGTQMRKEIEFTDRCTRLDEDMIFTAGQILHNSTEPGQLYPRDVTLSCKFLASFLIQYAASPCPLGDEGSTIYRGPRVLIGIGGFLCDSCNVSISPSLLSLAFRNAFKSKLLSGGGSNERLGREG